MNIEAENLDLEEELVSLRRVAKVVKGGRRFSFSALVVVGTRDGIVGIGLGKANEVPSAIKKAGDKAKKSLFQVKLNKGTIPHPIRVKFKGANILLKPAASGTGIIAGSSIRIIMNLAGVKDLLAKSLGSSNIVNIAKATEKALRELMDLTSVLKKRDKKFEDLYGKKIENKA